MCSSVKCLDILRIYFKGFWAIHNCFFVLLQIQVTKSPEIHKITYKYLQKNGYNNLGFKVLIHLLKTNGANVPFLALIILLYNTCVKNVKRLSTSCNIIYNFWKTCLPNLFPYPWNYNGCNYLALFVTNSTVFICIFTIITHLLLLCTYWPVALDLLLKLLQYISFCSYHKWHELKEMNAIFRPIQFL